MRKLRLFRDKYTETMGSERLDKFLSDPIFHMMQGGTMYFTKPVTIDGQIVPNLVEMEVFTDKVELPAGEFNIGLPILQFNN